MASEWVSILVDGQDMRAYVSQPETTGKVPGVIVIMEAFGVNKHIQEVTATLSREGYVAVAPVLYHRLGSHPLFSYTGEDAEMRTKAMGSLRDTELTRDLDITIAYLKGHAQVRADRLGIVGFCVGGRIAYLAATSCPGLSAAVVYYGGRILIPFGEGPTPFARTANIQCPVMGNFGALDQNPMPDEVRTIEAELKKHGKVCDFTIYPGANHGFNCDERPSYHAEAAIDAWARTRRWFQKYLKA
ncbi:MAG: dienelactone hydrolase family protein [Candidatus Entotheonellia bacterium]